MTINANPQHGHARKNAVAGIAIGIFSVLLCGQVEAHALLVHADPAKDSVIEVPPSEIKLTFNEEVGEEYLALAVQNDKGKRVDGHDASLQFGNHANLTASVSGMTSGKYLVRYRVLSADGHVVSGKYNFTIK